MTIIIQRKFEMFSKKKFSYFSQLYDRYCRFQRLDRNKNKLCHSCYDEDQNFAYPCLDLSNTIQPPTLLFNCNGSILSDDKLSVSTNENTLFIPATPARTVTARSEETIDQNDLELVMFDLERELDI
jgi:hypothetical protein